MKIARHVCLEHLNSFHVAHTAQYLLTVETEADIQEAFTFLQKEKMPHYALGGGSNILFTRDFEGGLIKNEIKGIKEIASSEKHIMLEVGGGENWHDLVVFCIKRGWQGLENLSLIPGTVGAAPIQNIGAFGVELCDVLEYVKLYLPSENQFRILTKAECQFGYRDSIFKNELKHRCFIISIGIRLNKLPNFKLSYAPLNTLKEEPQLTAKKISALVIATRQSRLPDPSQLGNAGSFFKNPLVRQEMLADLKKDYPSLKYFPTPSSAVKISAAWLIEQCGWKGKEWVQKQVGVYHKHALILVNLGGAKGSAIDELSRQIIQSVKAKFDIVLQREVNIV